MLIKDAKAFLLENKGKPDDEYEVKTVLVPDVGDEICRDHGGHNNCTLIGNMNVLKSLIAKGEFDMTDDDLYQLILEEANKVGYRYEKNNGVMVIRNKGLTKRIIKRIGLSKKVKGRYLPFKKSVCRYLDAGIPIIFSIAFGYYSNHTVTVKGYETYTNKKTGKSYTFLMLSDGWNKGTRYLRYTGFHLFWITHITTILQN